MRKICVLALTIYFVASQFCGCEFRQDTPEFRFQDLRSWDLRVDEVSTDNSLEELAEAWGPVTDRIVSPSGVEHLTYGARSALFEKGRIVALSGRELSVKGSLVEEDVSFSRFCSLHGVPKSMTKSVRRSHPEASLEFNGGYLTLALHKGKIIGYHLTLGPR